MSTQQSFDITQNRHKGNAESIAANPSREVKVIWQTRVLEYIESKCSWGATLAEICDRFGKGKNEVSPRLSELKQAHKVVKNGKRSGCAVLVHTKYAPEEK